MSAKILPLPGVRAPTQPIAHYLRIGLTGHRQLETLHGEGRLPATRVVVDASKLAFQKELVSALRLADAEIILDTNAAELSALARFDGAFKTAPWAAKSDGSPLRPEHFTGDARDGVIASIARYAVENDVHAVLAPGHFLRLANQDEWFEVDRIACVTLREALDREGGGRIAIDYVLIPTYTHLRDEAIRGAFLSGLHDLPFDNLWVRASGFGSDASALGARRYITALAGLHNLGKPIIADHVGGLIGLATAAFGTASGIAHGVGERERFDASQWDKPRRKKEEGREGGRTIRVTIPDLDKSVTRKELRMLAEARGGHRLVVCGDRDCCPHGLEDMIKNWRSHFLHQRFARTHALELVPDHNRTRHFIETDLAQADRLARQVKQLKTGDEDMAKRLVEHSRRVESRRAALENLYETLGDNTARAPEAKRRSGSQIEKHHGDV